MAEQAWTHVDKSAWGAGPWASEPDKVQWVDEPTGLDCLAVRHPSLGHWCGYVGVAEGHPLFEKGYSDALCGHNGCYEHQINVEVHGGLTFASACQEDADEGHGVCHIPEPGRPEKVWWFGFDCAHSGDLSPASKSPYSIGREVYRDLAYVKAEAADLAHQLAEVQPS